MAASRRRRSQPKEKGMMSVYPPFEIAAVLGGYRSNPFTQALRIAAQVLGDAAVAVASRFAAEEWELLRQVLAGRQWEPEVADPGALLADAVERAHVRTGIGHSLAKGVKDSPDKRVEVLAGKLREASYLDAWAVIIAVAWRLERDDGKPGDVKAGEEWWTIGYRAAKIEADKQGEG